MPHAMLGILLDLESARSHWSVWIVLKRHEPWRASSFGIGFSFIKNHSSDAKENVYECTCDMTSLQRSVSGVRCTSRVQGTTIADVAAVIVWACTPFAKDANWSC